MELRGASSEECSALARGQRPSSESSDLWAADFPQVGDSLLAAFYVGHATPTPSAPWGMWLIRAGRITVGTVCLKHPPTPAGEVEIGYGICPSHRRRGIATTAVALAVDLARSAGVKLLTADTDRRNIASVAVLRAHGFTRTGTTGATDWWRLSL